MSSVSSSDSSTGMAGAPRAVTGPDVGAATVPSPALLPASAAGGLGPMAGKVALPALIFRSMAKLDVGTVNITILIAIISAKWIVLALSLVFGVCLSVGHKNRIGVAGMIAICTTQSNDMALGLPVLRALYGHSSPNVDLLFVLSAASAIVVSPIDVTILELAKARSQAGGGGGLGKLLVKVASKRCGSKSRCRFRHDCNFPYTRRSGNIYR